MAYNRAKHIIFYAQKQELLFYLKLFENCLVQENVQKILDFFVTFLFIY